MGSGGERGGADSRPSQTATGDGAQFADAVLALLAVESATGTTFTSVFRPGSTTAPPRA